jgi:hypothetical protein
MSPLRENLGAKLDRHFQAPTVSLQPSKTAHVATAAFGC